MSGAILLTLYAVAHFGLYEAWPELVLNLFYIACLAMIGMYFFNRLDTHRVSAGRNMDSPNHYLRACGLFRN